MYLVILNWLYEYNWVLIMNITVCLWCVSTLKLMARHTTCTTTTSILSSLWESWSVNVMSLLFEDYIYYISTLCSIYALWVYFSLCIFIPSLFLDVCFFFGQIFRCMLYAFGLGMAKRTGPIPVCVVTCKKQGRGRVVFESGLKNLAESVLREGWRTKTVWPVKIKK